MGFLKFIKKKDKSGINLEMPLNPNMPDKSEDFLPSFPDDAKLDDLKLPALPDFDLDNSEVPGNSMPALDQLKASESQAKIHKPAEIKAPSFANEQSFPPFEPLGMPTPDPIASNIPMPPPFKKATQDMTAEQAYRLTPNSRINPDQPEYNISSKINEADNSPKDVFISGEEYRDLLEGLDSWMAVQKEKHGRLDSVKHEKELFTKEDKEHNRFISNIEDLQRSLVVADDMLFE